MLNLYGPKTDYPQFVHLIVKHLQDFTNSRILVGGDINAVIDPLAEKSHGSAHMHSTSAPGTIKSCMVKQGMVDIWRLFNPDEREYNCISHHKTIHILPL
ncbi:unnamed protein product [Oncorhynchus mykiss]|uniref:Endonuclease/exonuclease/phosphatase domain-containing protein n=1 Tax=Oncorhynchus mykiss TaxID=8022 RepID=A0A060XEZ6_ONCMY|nr:unnamed protein product [Oncorhynchus mykiss]